MCKPNNIKAVHYLFEVGLHVLAPYVTQGLVIAIHHTVTTGVLQLSLPLFIWCKASKHVVEDMEVLLIRSLRRIRVKIDVACKCV